MQKRASNGLVPPPPWGVGNVSYREGATYPNPFIRQRQGRITEARIASLDFATSTLNKTAIFDF